MIEGADWKSIVEYAQASIQSSKAQVRQSASSIVETRLALERSRERIKSSVQCIRESDTVVDRAHPAGTDPAAI